MKFIYVYIVPVAVKSKKKNYVDENKKDIFYKKILFY